MRKRIRWIVCVGLIPATLLLSGCLFNVFQTAKTIGEGNLAITIGSGLIVPGAQIVTPQARLAFGVSDRVDFGLQTGGMFSFDGELAGWLGAAADFKASLFSNPDSLSLALGIGASYSNAFVGPDLVNFEPYWVAFAGVFLDSNVPFLPIFASYRPAVVLRSPEEGEDIQILNHFAVGIALPISETARLLIELDIQSAGLNSVGIGFEAVI